MALQPASINSIQTHHQQKFFSDETTAYWPGILESIFVAEEEIPTQKEAAKSAVINLNDAHDLEISGKTISNVKEACITLTNCSNIRIKSCQFLNGTNRGVYLYNCHNITIENCFFQQFGNGCFGRSLSGRDCG